MTSVSELHYLRSSHKPDFQRSSQPVPPSGNFLRKFPYHLPPLQNFRNFGRIESTVVLNVRVTKWVALGCRWTRMENTCRGIGFERSKDSFP